MNRVPLTRQDDIIFSKKKTTKRAETIIYSKTDRVKCSGENNDHPAVYYTIPEDGEVVCMYCDIKFRREGE